MAKTKKPAKKSVGAKAKKAAKPAKAKQPAKGQGQGKKKKAAKAAPKKAAAKKAAPKKAAPKKAAAKKAAPRKAAPAKAPARKPAARKPPRAPEVGNQTLDTGWDDGTMNGEHDVSTNIVEAMALTALADGTVEATEQVMIARLAAQPALSSIQDLAQPIRHALDRFREIGAEAAMAECVAPIRDPLDRERAFLACVAVATADGLVKSSEIGVLEVLKRAFSYTADDVQRLVGG